MQADLDLKLLQGNFGQLSGIMHLRLPQPMPENLVRSTVSVPVLQLHGQVKCALWNASPSSCYLPLFSVVNCGLSWPHVVKACWASCTPLQRHSREPYCHPAKALNPNHCSTTRRQENSPSSNVATPERIIARGVGLELWLWVSGFRVATTRQLFQALVVLRQPCSMLLEPM